MQKTLRGIYERGTIRLGQRLPLRNHAPVFIKLTIPTPKRNPIRRTAGLIRVSPATARAIIYSDETDFLGA